MQDQNIYTYTISFKDKTDAPQEITISGLIQFELRYSAPATFKLVHYLENVPDNENNIDTDPIGYLNSKIDYNCKDIKIYYIMNEDRYLLKTIPTVSFINCNLTIEPSAQFNNEVKAIRDNFTKVFEIR